MKEVQCEQVDPNRCSAVTAPHRAPPSPCSTSASASSQPKICRRATASTPRASSGRKASHFRRDQGTVITHCRIGTLGSRVSTHRSAVWTLRRPMQAGQNARLLHESGTSRW
jgi:hypothetical protein